MEQNEKNFIESVKKHIEYDFISKNYMDFTKTQLKDIILELLYAINTDSDNESGVLNSAINELIDRWDY